MICFQFLLCEIVYIISLSFIDKDVDREATNWPLLKNYISSTDKLISKGSRLMVNNQSPNSFSYLRQILTTTLVIRSLHRPGRKQRTSRGVREYNKVVKCSLWSNKAGIISYNDTCPSYFVKVIPIIIAIIIRVIITIIITVITGKISLILNTSGQLTGSKR